MTSLDAWLDEAEWDDRIAGDYGYRPLTRDRQAVLERDARGAFRVGACCEECAKTVEPDVWMVGAACCDACAKTGKSCQVVAGTRDARSRFVTAVERDGFQEVNTPVGYVNAGQVNALDSAFKLLDAEVEAVNAALTPPSDESKVTFNGKALSSYDGATRGKFLVDFRDFEAKWKNLLGGGSESGQFGWRGWLGDSADMASRIIADDDFARWTSKYGQARDQWTKLLGQATKAPEPGSKALDGPGGGPMSGVQIPWWVWPAAGVAALIALAPILAPFATVAAARLGKVG